MQVCNKRTGGYDHERPGDSVRHRVTFLKLWTLPARVAVQVGPEQGKNEGGCEGTGVGGEVEDGEKLLPQVQLDESLNF